MALRSALLDLLFPKRCAACGVEDVWLCGDCRERMPLRLRHLPRHAGMGFDGAYALLPFDVPWVKHAVHDVKFGGTFGYLEAFGELLAERLTRVAERIGGFDAVTHVPLAADRKRRRGFDQAERLALDVAHHLVVPHRTLLTRNRATRAQAELGGRSRRQNVFAAFDPTPELFSHFLDLLDFQGERGHPMSSVLLVDDVFTTGATLSSAAKILKAFGVERVTAVSIAYRAEELFLARFKRRYIDWFPKKLS